MGMRRLNITVHMLKDVGDMDQITQKVKKHSSFCMSFYPVPYLNEIEINWGKCLGIVIWRNLWKAAH